MKITKKQQETKTLSRDEIERILCEYFDLNVDDDELTIEWRCTAHQFKESPDELVVNEVLLIGEEEESERDVSVRSQSDFEAASHG